MNTYTSQITFLYFDFLDEGKQFLQDTLGLKAVYEPDWAAVYEVTKGAYLGAVDAKRGSISSDIRGGTLVSLTVHDVTPYYEKILKSKAVTNLSGIKVFDDIGIKSFFFKGPMGYDFEIQQFTDCAHNFTKQTVTSDFLNEALVEAETTFCESSAIEGAAGWAKHFLPDGCMLTKSGNTINGQEAISRAMQPLFGLSGLKFTWAPTRAEVSEDHTLGYTYGKYHRSYIQSDGNQIDESGMYMTLWKKDESGGWRVLADIGN